MSSIEIEICGLCGKRTDKLPFVISLFREYKKPYYSKRTIWSRKLCENCGRKMTNTKTIADKITEDIELHIDKIRLSNKQPNLLKLGG